MMITLVRVPILSRDRSEAAVSGAADRALTTRADVDAASNAGEVEAASLLIGRPSVAIFGNG